MRLSPDTSGERMDEERDHRRARAVVEAPTTPPAPAANAGDAEGVFRLLLESLAPRVSLFVRRGFFEPLRPLSLDDDALTLLAPTAFHRDWVRDHYQDELLRALEQVAGVPLAVAIIHDEKALAALPPRPAAAPGHDPPVEGAQGERGAPGAPPPPTLISSRIGDARGPSRGSAPTLTAPARLSPKYTFSSFVAGPSNRMAYEACKAVAESPGRRYSPLFLFGKTGLGKTHLLHAIGQEALRHTPSLRVVYMSAEQWVNEYITDIRQQRFDDFRKRYRAGCDLLLIDDIQFLAGKDASQDEFFHTFNSLHDSRRQIVVTADRYPHEIEGLEQRLMTRLSWGLIADIQVPEVETRVAILLQKAEALGLAVDLEVMHFLADHIQTSVRALEGALVRLSAYAAVTGGRIDLRAAKEYLRPVLSRREDVTLDRVLKVVAAYYDLRVDELKGKSRQRRVAEARQTAMYLSRKHLGASLPEIGRAFGRDHTTVLASVRKIAGLLATHAGTQAVIARLERDLLP